MYKKNEKIVEKKYNDKLYLVNFETEERFYLDGATAECIWKNIETKCLKDIASIIQKDTNMEIDCVLNDMQQFINSLIINHLLMEINDV